MFLEPKFLTWNFWTFVTLFAYFPLILTKFFGVERIATNIFLSKRPSVVSFLLFNIFLRNCRKKSGKVSNFHFRKFWIEKYKKDYDSLKLLYWGRHNFTGANTTLLGQTQFYWGRHNFIGADKILEMFYTF